MQLPQPTLAPTYTNRSHATSLHCRESCPLPLYTGGEEKGAGGSDVEGAAEAKKRRKKKRRRELVLDEEVGAGAAGSWLLLVRLCWATAWRCRCRSMASAHLPPPPVAGCASHSPFCLPLKSGRRPAHHLPAHLPACTHALLPACPQDYELLEDNTGIRRQRPQLQHRRIKKARDTDAGAANQHDAARALQVRGWAGRCWAGLLGRCVVGPSLSRQLALIRRP